MAIIFGWPLLRYAWLSGHADSVLTGLVPVANGGANWLRLLSDQRFWGDALQTGRFGVVSVGIELILAMAIALLLDQRWRGREEFDPPGSSVWGQLREPAGEHTAGSGLSEPPHAAE